MAALEIVVAQSASEIWLDLIDTDVPGLPPSHAEALIEQRAVHALDEVVGARASEFRGSMLDVFHRQQQLVRMTLLDAAELAAIVGTVNPGRTDLDALQSQLVGDALCAVGRER